MTEEKPAYKKKLIEVAMPLDIINESASKEKSIRHGNISTLHLWWSRKPLAAAKAVLFASLVDDPGNYLPQKQAEKERKRLFKLIGSLVKWKDPNKKDTLRKVKEEISKYSNNKSLSVLDPFCGGGSIPLAGQILGLDSYGSDLNPVAVLISKGLVELPTIFVNRASVNPNTPKNKLSTDFNGAQGLAQDLRYYGQKLYDQLNKKIGHLYPKGPNNETVVAWLWARGVKCSNPACFAHTPLIPNTIIRRKNNSCIYLDINANNKTKKFMISLKEGRESDAKKLKVTSKGANFECVFCGSIVNEADIKTYATTQGFEYFLKAIVTEGNRKRNYYAPTLNSVKIENLKIPRELELELPIAPRYISPPLWGMKTYSSLFTDRQLNFMIHAANSINEIKDKIIRDITDEKLILDSNPIVKGGRGAVAYAEIICTYLAFVISKCADYYNNLCCWNVQGEKIEHLFGRQAIQMSWDFAEANPFSNSSKNFMDSLELTAEALEDIRPNSKGIIHNLDSTITLDFGSTQSIISTDPPYYDMISYSDLSDFFYVWLRYMLKSTYPDLFSTVVTPKSQELVAASSVFSEENKEEAKNRFLDGIEKSFKLMKEKQSPDYPLTIYYAFKQSEEENSMEGNKSTSSTGWETMLQGLINSGFKIVGTWPMRTERSARPRSVGSNALASSIVLVCRPRSENATIATRRDFITSLKKELPSALRNLQDAGIAPVDMAQSAIGPGMAVFSRYSKVLEADGNPMSVRTGLQIINQELDTYFTEQESDMDKETRFCIAWYEQFGWKEAAFGDANTLATAKGTAVNALENAGVIYAKAGKVRLLKRTEFDVDWDPTTDKFTVWECVQYLIKALEDKGETGAAEILKKIGGFSEPVKELAYRLYALCEKKGWAEDGLAYNNLISSWQSVTDKAQFASDISESTKKRLKDKEQKTLTDL